MEGWKLASSFLTAVSAVFPFLIYLGIGFLITHSGMEDVSFIKRLNKITFRTDAGKPKKIMQ